MYIGDFDLSAAWSNEGKVSKAEFMTLIQLMNPVASHIT